MNTKLLRDLVIKAVYESDSINDPDSHKLYIPDSFRDAFAKAILKEVLEPFQRPADECTTFECMADDYATNAIKRRFGLDEVIS